MECSSGVGIDVPTFGYFEHRLQIFVGMYITNSWVMFNWDIYQLLLNVDYCDLKSSGSVDFGWCDSILSQRLRWFLCMIIDMLLFFLRDYLNSPALRVNIHVRSLRQLLPRHTGRLKQGVTGHSAYWHKRSSSQKEIIGYLLGEWLFQSWFQMCEANFRFNETDWYVLQILCQYQPQHIE